MTNYSFNGMNAHTIADRIIANEESYLKTDFTSLSFEDKCRFINNHNGSHHPLYKLIDLKSELKEIYNELLRRVEKKEDGFCLYHLYVLCWAMKRTRGEAMGYLTRAHKALYPDACIEYAGWVAESDREKLDIAEKVLDILSLGDITERDEHTLYHAYELLSQYGQTPEDRARYARLADELALDSVLRGEYSRLTHLCVKESGVPAEKWSDEHVFWKTVSFIVDSTLYDRYSVHLGELLGLQMLRGLGCEPDAERARRFFLDVFFRAKIDRDKALELLDISKGSSEADLRAALRESIADGDSHESAMGYGKLILTEILKGDKDAVGRIFDEALEDPRGNILKVMITTYTLLCRVGA